jgi:signal peptidase I
LLAVVAAPLGLLYVGRAALASAYFGVLILGLLLDAWLTGLGYFAPLTLLITLAAAIHAFRIASRSEEAVARPWFSRWYGLAGIAALAALAVFSMRAFLAEPFRTPSQSMYPSLPRGSYVLVSKWGYGYYEAYGIRLLEVAPSSPLIRGDLYVFDHPSGASLRYIKRLVGLPGDLVQYRGKQLFVNGRAAEQSSSPRLDPKSLQIFTESLGGRSYQIAIDPEVPSRDLEARLQAGQLFFLGDNRDNSTDSRHWGVVPVQHIVGKVVYVLRP